MVRLYCLKKEKNTILCPDCEILLQYTHTRLDKCHFGETKPTCKHCPIHCYKPEMRKQIQKVMRFAGPRMLFTSPFETIRHLISLQR